MYKLLSPSYILFNLCGSKKVPRKKQPINHPYKETNYFVEEKTDIIRELEVLKSGCQILESSNEDL